jgi:hypothetical protein
MQHDHVEQPQQHTDRSNHSSLSVSILLLITVLACGIGVVAAFCVQQLTVFKESPAHYADYRSISPQWITYHQGRMFPCEVNEPTCFTTSETGTLLIGEKNPPSVRIFSLAGQFLQAVPLEKEPTVLAVGKSDQPFAGMYVVAHADQIAVYSPEGKQQRSWNVPGKKPMISSFAFTSDTLLAVDNGGLCVHQFDAEGKLIRTFGNAGTSAFEGFVVYAAPMTMTVSPKTGLIHVTNPGKHRIETFTPEGIYEPELSWGEPSSDLSGFVGCCNPVDIAALDDGRVLTVEKAVTRIKIFRTNRLLDCVVAGPGILDRLPEPAAAVQQGQNLKNRLLDVALLPNNDVAVFDPLWNIVRVFSANEHR